MSPGRSTATPAPLRIGMVIDAVYPYHMGGKEVRYRQLSDRLATDNDLELTYYTMHWWGTEPVDGPVRYRAISPKLTMYRGRRRSTMQAAIFALCCLKMLWAPVDVIDADHMPYLPLFTLWFVSRVRRMPLLVSWNEFWGREHWIAYMGQAGRLAAFLEHVSTKIPTTIVSISPGTTARLEASGVPSSKITTIPGAIDSVVLAALPAVEGTPDLLCVGRLIDHKRVDVALEVTASLRERGRMVTLGVIGRGPDRDSLVALARARGIDSAVTFYDSIDETDTVLGMIKATSVLVFASEREGFGIVAAEAMALGTPVVTSSGPDNEARRLVTEGITGSICPAGDVAAFADATEWWLDHQDRDVAAAFRQEHGELEWATMAERYREVLDSVAPR